MNQLKRNLFIMNFGNNAVTAAGTKFKIELNNHLLWEDAVLLLKPLTKMSDKDILEIYAIEFSSIASKRLKIVRSAASEKKEAKIEIADDHKTMGIFDELNLCWVDRSPRDNPFIEGLSIQSYHYLLSKGFALPFRNLTTYQLIKKRLYKLV
jgi:hypothetical protein